eukprot:m.124239 g.124239  ORF g.124239 m.124239 type:complete len:56 (-) comp15698_c0_seq5:2519-2686(-)
MILANKSGKEEDFEEQIQDHRLRAKEQKLVGGEREWVPDTQLIHTTGAWRQSTEA